MVFLFLGKVLKFVQAQIYFSGQGKEGKLYDRSAKVKRSRKRDRPLFRKWNLIHIDPVFSNKIFLFQKSANQKLF